MASTKNWGLFASNVQRLFYIYNRHQRHLEYVQSEYQKAPGNPTRKRWSNITPNSNSSSSNPRHISKPNAFRATEKPLEALMVPVV